MQAALANLSPAKKREALVLLEEKARRKAQTRFLDIYRRLYDWQSEFEEATGKYHECCLCAANQIGKTWLGTLIDAIHLMGEYPEEWRGHKFDKPPLCWGLGYSLEKTRDLLQSALFGDYIGGEFSGGLVPKDKIVRWESAAGVPNAARSVTVKHKKGYSKIQFWSYNQGQHAIMGDVVDWFHVDEEPKDQAIRPQVLTRTINGDQGNGGRGIYTFTPENGRTDLVVQFKDSPSPNQFFMQKGWDDAPHMTAEKKERLLEQYPVHQRDMRTKGEPMLGHGRIYDIAEGFVAVEPFEIPDHWAIIDGMDFGWDHPQARIRLAHDRDSDVIYVTHAWKARHSSANDAFGVAKGWGYPYPTAWPQDGLQHEKGRDDALQQKSHYVNAGFNMLHEHATWPMVDGKSGGNSVEQGLYEIYERKRNGTWKVFNGCVSYFDEMRQYHRDEKGRIVKTNDDILDAARYAYMMRRFAKVKGEIANPTKPYIPKPMKVMGARR